jgi:glutathione synthase/RimK-type ligase-like ATP-grasp enzyme
VSSVDRISHEVEYFRAYLKHAVLEGTYVINNPFWWTADDKFFNYSVARKLGVAVPNTIVLPQKAYPATSTSPPSRCTTSGIRSTGTGCSTRLAGPAILKPYSGGGWKHVYKVHNRAELLEAYDKTAPYCMTLQQFIHFDQYVRCFTFGKNDIVPVAYDPHQRKYLVEHEYLLRRARRRASSATGRP